jgi:hypothetical protein
MAKHTGGKLAFSAEFRPSPAPGTLFAPTIPGVTTKGATAMQTMNKNNDQNVLARAGAAGWAFLVWLFGGGIGLAIAVFVILKLIGG